MIATDAASFERLGTVGRRIANRKLLINIDHHESNTRYGDLNWVSAREPSTGELIFRLLKIAKWPITKPHRRLPLHRRLDRHRLLSISDHAARHLSRRGRTGAAAAPTSRRSATRSINPIRSPASGLLRHIYSHFRLTHENQIAYFWLKKADFARTGAESSDTEGLIDHIRAIAPVVVACVFEEIEPELTRISLRSKSDKVNVNEIAAQFGGGGHPAAAGARIPGKPLSVQRRVVAAIRRALELAAT